MRIVSFLLASLLFPLISSAQPEDVSVRLKVGIIAPLSGPLAEYGVAVRNGIELARRENSEIDSRCDFAIEDSKYDSSTAITIFQKLVSADRSRVVYNWGGPTSEALAPIATRKDVALYVWSADPRVSEGRARVVRFSNSGADYGRVLAAHLRARGFQKVAVFKTDNQYLEAVYAGLKASSGDLQVDLLDSFQPGDKDFRSSIIKLKVRAYDAVGLFLLSGQVSLFSVQLRAMGVEAPIFGTDFFESMTEVRESKGTLVGATFANNEVSPTFRARYLAAFSNDFQINHAANGFDFALFLCKQLGSGVSGLSAEEILLKTSQVGQVSGQQGEARLVTSTAGDKYFNFPVVIRRITNSEIVTDSKG
jgi:branched-chain amino acid transport system substrate-binding protein